MLQLSLTNFLSFGPKVATVDLLPLNVLIGPNGSGKSNLIEALSILRSAPDDIGRTIREGGGILEWLHRRDASAVASVEAVFAPLEVHESKSVHYRLELSTDGRLAGIRERIETATPLPGHDKPFLFFGFENGRAMLNVRGDTQRGLRREDIDSSRSILAQRRDPESYPELTRLGALLDSIRIYRDWQFGRATSPRLPQRADLPNDFPLEDWTNLGLVLNELEFGPAGAVLVERMGALFDGLRGVKVKVGDGSVQVFLQEGNSLFPATRLSDGTLRYLCLLTILCHPKPPPLVVIEEPELGLHPDVVVGLAELLREASQRTQLVVTTHSDLLVSALSDTPESVVVCEKHEGVTSLKRLDADELAPWLERYRLGDLWKRGDLGGNRW